MSFRIPALVAAVVVFGSAELAQAQPQAPVRPRYSSFGNIFSPNRGPVGGAGFGQNQPFVNPIGPQVAGIGGPQGFAYPGVYGQGAVPPALIGAYGAIDPTLPPTGVVGSFNNLGHWYGGNYGHWYPGGVANGTGILGGGGVYGGSVGVGRTGTARLGGGAGGALLGTAMTAGATMNQFRR